MAEIANLVNIAHFLAKRTSGREMAGVADLELSIELFKTYGLGATAPSKVVGTSAATAAANDYDAPVTKRAKRTLDEDEDGAGANADASAARVAISIDADAADAASASDDGSDYETSADTSLDEEAHKQDQSNVKRKKTTTPDDVRALIMSVGVPHDTRASAHKLERVHANGASDDSAKTLARSEAARRAVKVRWDKQKKSE